MERYREIANVSKIESGKRKYESLRYPKFTPKDTDIYIYSKRHMRLDLLANVYYDDARLWFIIARVNKLGKGSLVVPPGLRLRIPYPLSAEEIVDEFYKINERA